MLNANYLLSRVKHILPCRKAIAACTSSSPRPPKLKSDKGISAMDIAKRLLDFGFHAPTVYFPLIGERSDDDRADRNRKQGNARRLRRNAVPHHRRRPRVLHEAPHTTPISRPDEVQPPASRCWSSGRHSEWPTSA